MFTIFKEKKYVQGIELYKKWPGESKKWNKTNKKWKIKKLNLNNSLNIFNERFKSIAEKISNLKNRSEQSIQKIVNRCKILKNG